VTRTVFFPSRTAVGGDSVPDRGSCVMLEIRTADSW
jgi:hypothetical protein